MQMLDSLKAALRGWFARYVTAARMELRRMVLDRLRPIEVPENLELTPVATLNALRERRLPPVYLTTAVVDVGRVHTMEDGTTVFRCVHSIDSDGESMLYDLGLKRVGDDVLVVGWIELWAIWRRPAEGDMYYRDARLWFESLPAGMRLDG